MSQNQSHNILGAIKHESYVSSLSKISHKRIRSLDENVSLLQNKENQVHQDYQHQQSNELGANYDQKSVFKKKQFTNQQNDCNKENYTTYNHNMAKKNNVKEMHRLLKQKFEKIQIPANNQFINANTCTSLSEKNKNILHKSLLSFAHVQNPQNSITTIPTQNVPLQTPSTNVLQIQQAPQCQNVPIQAIPSVLASKTYTDNILNKPSILGQSISQIANEMKNEKGGRSYAKDIWNFLLHEKVFFSKKT